MEAAWPEGCGVPTGVAVSLPRRRPCLLVAAARQPTDEPASTERTRRAASNICIRPRAEGCVTCQQKARESRGKPGHDL